MTLALTAAGLVLPVLIGGLLGAVGLFRDPDAAVDVLNRFALYVGFPLLIVVGMVDRGFTVPTELGFWIAIPAAAALCTLVLAVLGLVPALRDSRGALVLTTVWGNVAYVGLPVVEGVLGGEWLGLASLAVALHVLVSMILGPTLLLAWSPAAAEVDPLTALRRAVVSVLRQPLAWSPVVGLLLRLLPAEALSPLVAVIKPVAGTAGPVALVLIGLFLHTHHRRLRPDLSAVVHVLAKLVLLPLATLAVVVPLGLAGWVTPEQTRLLLLLAAMPTAISTFAIAVQFEVAVERVAVAVVASTVLAAGWVPLVVWWTG